MSFFMSAGLLIEDYLRDLSDRILSTCGINEMLNSNDKTLDKDYSSFDIAEAIAGSDMWIEGPSETLRRSALELPEFIGIVQRPVLNYYRDVGLRFDDQPFVDIDMELGGQLLLEMPYPVLFVPSTQKIPGVAQYSDTSAVLRMAKQLYGAFLSEGFDYVANFVCIVGKYELS